MKTHFTPYEGDEKYIFVSYSHLDSDTVGPILDNLSENGFRIWYDEGIEWGSEWPETIASHLRGCEVCMVFHSHFSIESQNCRQEIYYALKNKKGILSVYLEQVELSDGIDMQLSPFQSTYLYQYNDPDLFFDRLVQAKILQSCKTFANGIDSEATAKRAVPIPFIPKELMADEAFSSYPDAYNDGNLLLGVDYATAKPLPVKIARLGVLAVSGNESDVVSFQRYLITSIEKNDGLKAEFYIADSIDRVLLPLSDYSCVAAYGFLPEQATQMLLQVEKKAEERYMHVAEGDTSALDTSPTLVLMINDSEALNVISSDKTALEAWRTLTGKLKNMNVCTILGNLDNAHIPFSMEILRKFRDNEKVLFFDDLLNYRIGDLPYAPIKMFSGKKLQKGDGYLILGNNVKHIRVPSCL